MSVSSFLLVSFGPSIVYLKGNLIVFNPMGTLFCLMEKLINYLQFQKIM